MLCEMTRSALAYSFKRFAQGAVVGFALTGLAACGGGGSSTPAKTIPTPTPPKISIRPAPTDLPAPAEAELEAATVISAGETVTGTLESADDVKYYRLEVAETSVVELTIDAEAGTEIALLDSSGRVVLVHAVTASKATLRHMLEKGSYYVRAAAKKINESKTFRLLSKVTKASKYVGTVINILRGIPKVDIPLGVAGEINIDLRGVFDGQPPITYRIGGQVGILSAHIEQESIRLSPTSDAVPGSLKLTVTATRPEVDNIPGASVSFTANLVEPPNQAPRPKPEYADGDVLKLLTPGQLFSAQVFEYMEDEQVDTLRWEKMETLRSIGTGWSARLIGTETDADTNKHTLHVELDADQAMADDNIRLRLTAIDEENLTGTLVFIIGAEDPVPPAACEQALRLYAAWSAADDELVQLGCPISRKPTVEQIRSGDRELPDLDDVYTIGLCPTPNQHPQAYYAAHDRYRAAKREYDAAYEELAGGDITGMVCVWSR